MSRRLETPSVHGFETKLANRIRATEDAGLITFLDGKALTVGGGSKDPDARSGWAPGGMARGYKLHCFWGKRPFPEVWDVRPLNQNERRVAPELVPELKGSGYILAFGDTRVYFSGDTECTPEMKALTNITIAFLSMNPPRTMSTIEAADCAKAIRPKIVYPYHYRGSKTEEFAAALNGVPGVEVRLRKLEGEP